MEDKDIINLYWERNPKAINETVSKYGSYCKSIAKNILHNNEDVEECVNDTYLRAWDSMPPHRPKILSTFLGKITRNLSFDKLRNKNAVKRGGGEIHLVLDELAECVSGTESVENEYTRKLLVKEIDNFLNTLQQDKCDIFLLRYWYVKSISEISKQLGISENTVSVNLNRMRKKLKEHLTERGYDL